MASTLKVGYSLKIKIKYYLNRKTYTPLTCKLLDKYIMFLSTTHRWLCSCWHNVTINDQSICISHVG